MKVCDNCHKQWGDDVSICPDDGAPVRKQAAAAPAQPEDPLIGRMIGSYRITKALGKGGMGAVYAAEHPAIGSKVAIKFLHPQYAADKGVVTRFFNEAKAVNLIKHDNIVQVLDYMYVDEVMPCFVMEFLDKGYPMTKLTGQPVPLAVTGPILLQLCDALAAAHDKQIVHRDLKPDNIFLSVRNYRKHFVKVMDFGIAKLSNAEDNGGNNTQTGSVMGTPSYMSPEQASGKTSEIGPASDIYSLGMIMYQLAVGKVPFKGGFGEVLAAHLYQEAPPPRSKVPEIPEGYEAIILRCIAKKPEERFADMRELQHAIHEVMTQQGISAELPLDDSSGASAPASRMSSGGISLSGAPSQVKTSTGPKENHDGPTSYPNLKAAPAAPEPRQAEVGTLVKPIAPAPVDASEAGTLIRPSAAAVPARPAPAGTNWVAVAVALALGFALPVALVKGGVVHVRPAAVSAP